MQWQYIWLRLDLNHARACDARHDRQMFGMANKVRSRGGRDRIASLHRRDPGVGAVDALGGQPPTACGRKQRCVGFLLVLPRVGEQDRVCSSQRRQHRRFASTIRVGDCAHFHAVGGGDARETQFRAQQTLDDGR